VIQSTNSNWQKNWDDILAGKLKAEQSSDVLQKLKKQKKIYTDPSISKTVMFVKPVLHKEATTTVGSSNFKI
jgi:nitrate reductase beta subunit